MKTVILAVVFFLWVSTFACGISQRLPVEYPPIDTLLIDLSTFPEGWEATEPDFEPPPHAPWSGPGHLVEYVRQNFYSQSNPYTGVIVEIRRYDSEQSATREYERRLKVIFREDLRRWMPFPGVNHASTMADQAHYSCSGARCIYFARFGVYIYYSDVRIHNTDTITYSNILPVLFQAIDERMTLVLDSK